jgi:hypothetical protein
MAGADFGADRRVAIRSVDLVDQTLSESSGRGLDMPRHHNPITLSDHACI